MDEKILRWINGWPEELAPFMHFFSEATGRVWVRLALIVLTLVLAIAGSRTRRAAFGALIAFPIANEITDLFKHLDPQLRPYQKYTDLLMHTVGNLPAYGTSAHDAANFGTASAHSANMAAVATVFCLRLGWWGSPAVVIAFVTGISRIYLGAHFPYQVLLGWVCGVVAGFGTVLAWDLVAARVEGRKRNVDEK